MAHPDPAGLAGMSEELRSALDVNTLTFPQEFLQATLGTQAFRITGWPEGDSEQSVFVCLLKPHAGSYQVAATRFLHGLWNSIRASYLTFEGVYRSCTVPCPSFGLLCINSLLVFNGDALAKSQGKS